MTVAIPTIAAAQAFSDVNPDGSLRELVVGEARDWAIAIEYLVKVLGLDGGPLYYLTLADLTANTTEPATRGAIVWADGTVANNGIYKSTGLGGWTKIAGLPGNKFIVAVNAGAGTANAIQATTPFGVPSEDGGALVALPIVATNTASPATVAFDGGGALTIKNSNGTDVPVNALKSGEVVWGYKSGSTFRLQREKSVYLVCTTAAGGSPNQLSVATPHGLPQEQMAAMIVVPVAVDNDDSPVGITFDATYGFTIKTASGNDVAPSALKGGTDIVGFINSSGYFQLLSDQATAAIQAACEAARTGAEAARDAAVAAAATAVSVSTKSKVYGFIPFNPDGTVDPASKLTVIGPNGVAIDTSASTTRGFKEAFDASFATVGTFGADLEIPGLDTSTGGAFPLSGAAAINVRPGQGKHARMGAFTTPQFIIDAQMMTVIEAHGMQTTFLTFTPAGLTPLDGAQAIVNSDFIWTTVLGSITFNMPAGTGGFSNNYLKVTEANGDGRDIMCDIATPPAGGVFASNEIRLITMHDLNSGGTFVRVGNGAIPGGARMGFNEWHVQANASNPNQIGMDTFESGSFMVLRMFGFNGANGGVHLRLRPGAVGNKIILISDVAATIDDQSGGTNNIEPLVAP